MTQQRGDAESRRDAGQNGPLAGIRILDLTHMLAGPYATMLLADQGADIVKIEPLRGDFIRTAGPTYGIEGEEFGGYFHSVNRNKRSLSIDLSTVRGKELFLRLVDTADAVVENFRVGVMESLGIGWETLRDRNPRLVYGCIRGFGDPRTGKSPYVDWPAYDIVAQAMGGFMAVNGFPDREPVKSGIGIGDLFPAALLDIGVLSAVLRARATGEGGFVDVGMYDALISLAERNVYQHSIQGSVPSRIGNRHPIFSPFGVFETKTGWVTIAAPSDREFTVLAPLIGMAELLDDERFAHAHARGRNDALVQETIENWTRQRTSEEVIELLGGYVPVGSVQTSADIAADPHVSARDMIVEVEHPGTDRMVAIAGNAIKFANRAHAPVRRAPRLGEHTAELLAELGIEGEDVVALIADEIVASPTVAVGTSSATSSASA